MLRHLRRLFSRKVRAYKIDEHLVTEAFKFDGVTYYHFDDTFKMPSGRGMMALTIYEEFNMRVTADYLDKHIRAMEILLDDPQKISIRNIIRLNENLKERRNLALLPDHIYRLASVLFFDENESPYVYDQAYNEKKIQRWRSSEGVLDFFLKQPLKDLIPFSDMPAANAATYFETAEKIDQIHRSDLQQVLSRKE